MMLLMKIEAVIEIIETCTINLNEQHEMIIILPNVKSMVRVPNNYGSS